VDLATSPPEKAARDTMVDPGISQSPWLPHLVRRKPNLKKSYLN